MIQADIQPYFDEFIRSFIYQDIRRCIAAEANFVVALSLLSYTEFLGGLCTGNLGADGQSAANFSEGLRRMSFGTDQNYYNNFRVRYTDESGTASDAGIYKIFRCGLVHEYFGKGGVLIHNNPDGTVVAADAGVGWVDDGAGGERLRLHTNAYFRDLQAAFEELYRQVVTAGDAASIANFLTGAGRLFSRRLQKIT